MSYDFSALNDKEFEKLARDVLNQEFGLDLQDFKVGKDKGIDLRFSSPDNKNSIVVQAKHYRKSGLKKLLYDLEQKEANKVKNFAPDRYIFVTSVELDSGAKDEIVEIFRPFIQTANDIIGSEDLNKYLSEYPELEKRWFKLWLSSVNVLNTVLHNAVLGRSAFAAEKIKRSIQLYCHSKSYDDAFNILLEHKYILITGQPGVGKTTLANYITYQMLADGHQLIYIDSDVKDAEGVFNDDPSVKQIFYFDDFLGANYLEIINPKTSESAFVNFLERVKSTEGKYLILTTRTTILKTALHRYEKLQRNKVDIARKEIELGQYSELDKGRILYNHLYHSDLGEHLEEVLANKNYWDIIIHKNYNPRLIEFITDPSNSKDVVKGKFMDFALKNLKNPEEVWRHAYEEQLTVEEKLLLHAVFSKKQRTELQETNLLFKSFLNHETQRFFYRPSANPFKNSCKKLLDGILKKEHIARTNEEYLEFINPSINDFLVNYFINNEEERLKLYEGSGYIEQFENYYQYFIENPKTKSTTEKEVDDFIRHLLLDRKNLTTYQALKLEGDRNKFSQLRIAALFNKFRSNDDELVAEVESNSLSILTEYGVENISIESAKYYVSLLKFGGSDTVFAPYVKSNWDRIILRLFDTALNESDYDAILYIFDIYDVSFEEYIAEEVNFTAIHPYLMSYLETYTPSWVRDSMPRIWSEDDWEGVKSEVRTQRLEFLERFSIDDYLYNEDDFFGHYDVIDVISDNASRKDNRNGEKLIGKHRSEEYVDKQEKEIEELFLGKYDDTDAELIASKKLPF